MKRCIAIASSSRFAVKSGPTSKLPVRLLHTPTFTPIATTSYSPSQFTIPQLLPFPNPTSPYESHGKGKGKSPEPPRSNEEEVDDAEWQMRVGTFFRRLSVRWIALILCRSCNDTSSRYPSTTSSIWTFVC
jgi:hypothetical protein